MSVNILLKCTAQVCRTILAMYSMYILFGDMLSGFFFRLTLLKMNFFKEVKNIEYKLALQGTFHHSLNMAMVKTFRESTSACCIAIGGFQ